jgi:hypothetical protein
MDAERIKQTLRQGRCQCGNPWCSGNIAYELCVEMEVITKLIPETFYADRPIEERIKYLIEAWQRAVVALRRAEDVIEKIRNCTEEIDEALRGLSNVQA